MDGTKSCNVWHSLLVRCSFVLVGYVFRFSVRHPATPHSTLSLSHPIDNSFAIISPYLHGIHTKSYNSDVESHGTVFSPPHPRTVRKLHLHCEQCSARSSFVGSRWSIVTHAWRRLPLVSREKQDHRTYVRFVHESEEPVLWPRTALLLAID